MPCSKKSVTEKVGWIADEMTLIIIWKYTSFSKALRAQLRRVVFHVRNTPQRQNSARCVLPPGIYVLYPEASTSAARQTSTRVQIYPNFHPETERAALFTTRRARARFTTN